MSLPQAERAILIHALLGVVWPALACAAVLLASARLERGRGAALAQGGPAGPGLALGFAFAAGYVAIVGWPPLALSLGPRQQLFYLALAAGAYGAWEARAARASIPGRCLLSLLAPLLLLRFQREQHWTRAESVAWTAALAALVFLSWQALAARERSLSGAAATLGRAMAEALAAAAYQSSGSQTLAQLSLALAVGLGTCALGGFVLRRSGPGAGAVAPFLLLHHGLVWCARFLSELSSPGFVLLSVAPLGAWLSQLAPAARPRVRAGLALLGPVCLAGAATWIELQEQPRSPYGY